MPPTTHLGKKTPRDVCFVSFLGAELFSFSPSHIAGQIGPSTHALHEKAATLQQLDETRPLP